MQFVLILKENSMVNMTRSIDCDPNRTVLWMFVVCQHNKHVLTATANNLLQCNVAIKHRIRVEAEPQMRASTQPSYLSDMAGAETITAR